MESKKINSNFFSPLPGTTFLIVAVIFLILSFFQLGESVDIHLHDTMYVVSSKFICCFLAILCGIEFLIYRYLNFLMYSTRLSWISVSLSLLSFGLIIISISFPELNHPRQEFSAQEWKEHLLRNNMYALFTGGSFLLSLVILVLNITIGSFKKIFPKK